MVNFLISAAIAVASSVLNAILQKGPEDGQRVTDMNAPQLNPGQRIARAWGCPGVQGTVIWTRGLIETKHKHKAGGFAGIGAKTYYTYTYSTDIAVAVCIGPQKGIRRIWASDKLVYSGVIVEGEDAKNIADWSQKMTRLSLKTMQTRRAALRDGKLGASDQSALTNYITFVESTLTGLSDAAELIGSSTTALDAAWAAFKTTIDGLDFGSPLIYTDEKVLQTQLDAYRTQLDALNDIFAASVEGTSRAYLDGVAVESAQKVGDRFNFTSGAGFFDKLAFAIGKIEGSAGVRYKRLNIYRGTKAQEPDDIMEAELGVGNVPGYRGVMYFVMQGLELKDFGNSLPTFKIEIEGGDTDSKALLVDVVSDICLDAGLRSSEFSIGRMDATAKVRGFALTDQTSAREALEHLRKVHPFDVIESNYKVRFIYRYSPVVATIRREDLGATEFDSEFPDTFENSRAHVDEMPREIQFSYQDRNREMSLNTAKSRRTSNAATETESYTLPLVMKPVEAKEAVDQYMVYKYGSRRTYTLNLPVKYFILDPGDVVQIPRKDNPYGTTVRPPYYRVVSTTLGSNGIVELGLTDHVVPISVQNPAFDPDVEDEVIGEAGSTEAQMLDLPLLYNDDRDTPGYYVALRNSKAGWRGGSLYIDNNSGGAIVTPGGSSSTAANEDWEAVASTVISAPCGILMVAGKTACPNLWDRTTSLTLFMLTPGFEPEACAEADALRSSINRVAINGEVLQFTDVEDIGDNCWRLSNLIRGQFGTESFIGAHPQGSMVVWLTDDAVQRVEHDKSLLNVTKDFRSINLGDEITDGETFQFTPTGVCLKPRAPAFVRRVEDPATGDITLSWQPRARQNGQWKDGADVTFDQAEEAYEVEIYNGVTLKRTLSVTGARSVVYTSAQKVADFGAGGPAIGALKVRVYQIGAIVGRGFTNQVSL